MSRSGSKAKKLEVLQLVKEYKHILFGTFPSDEALKLRKEEAWLSVLQKAQFLGLTSTSNSWTYARDHLFGLWKSRTLAKYSKADKTGSVILDDVDRMILDIINNDETALEPCQKLEFDVTKTEPEFNAPKVVYRKRKIANEPVEDLKRRLLESELHINKLKIYKMEMELNLPPSEFTEEFYL